MNSLPKNCRRLLIQHPDLMKIMKDEDLTSLLEDDGLHYQFYLYTNPPMINIFFKPENETNVRGVLKRKYSIESDACCS